MKSKVTSTCTTTGDPIAIALFQDHLRQIGACSKAREWAEGMDANRAWETCHKADWLLWWIARDMPEVQRDIVWVACKIARLVLHLVPAGEDRPRLAIEAAEKWADDPTEENLAAVRVARRNAAAAAADAAYAAAAAAAADAAYAAAYAAAAAAAYADAADAAAAAADAAAYAARAKMQTQCLAIIREQFTCPWNSAL